MKKGDIYKLKSKNIWNNRLFVIVVSDKIGVVLIDRTGKYTSGDQLEITDEFELSDWGTFKICCL